MTDKKNIVASVLARLRNTAKSSGAPFQQILQQYAIERFLYRISKSEHAQTVVLKGALLLKTIGIPRARPTMDIDMLRKGKADQPSLIALVKDCATLKVEPDGLTFLADSIVAEGITKDSEYKGTRKSRWGAGTYPRREINPSPLLPFLKAAEVRTAPAVSTRVSPGRYALRPRPLEHCRSRMRVDS